MRTDKMAIRMMNTFSPDSMRKFLASGTAIKKPATDPPAWAE
eukprot:CAMPEP_0177547228 /NCGR_PEP_ID=MMETSP0369-20130122/63709_1 /TAXON_ID=447022 ORGANISM="Scrippsiella hangoei-like, Strain SHHI-4" /NCGR_SAMPLE_ID=MMETSP0369 /ASSEMBLY_ACC=CAM_ASM_000364 /LENGTH=41 /DNA_ID= /DNA_START= /DNA_END= /DNA_ORIENTATION=